MIGDLNIFFLFWTGTINQSIDQRSTLFNFEFVDSKIANILEENKSIT